MYYPGDVAKASQWRKAQAGKFLEYSETLKLSPPLALFSTDCNPLVWPYSGEPVRDADGLVAEVLANLVHARQGLGVQVDI